MAPISTEERKVLIRLKDGSVVITRAIVSEENRLLYLIEMKDLFEEIPRVELQKLDKIFRISKAGNLIVTVKGCRSDKETLKKMRNILRDRDF